jgi:hypothetical protein
MNLRAKTTLAVVIMYPICLGAGLLSVLVDLRFFWLLGAAVLTNVILATLVFRCPGCGNPVFRNGPEHSRWFSWIPEKCSVCGYSFGDEGNDEGEGEH